MIITKNGIALMHLSPVAPSGPGGFSGGDDGAGDDDPAPADDVDPEPVVDDSDPDGNHDQPQGDEPGQDDPPAYQPNLKFTVMDKEHEVDEWLRPLMTDADSEKRVLDLLQKAHGLEYVKMGKQQLADELTSTKAQLGQMHSRYTELDGYLRQGDLDTFFEECRIPPDAVLRYALKLINLNENPQAMGAYQEARRIAAQNRELSRQNAGLQQSYGQTAGTSKEREVDIALARPEVLAVAQAYDQRVGKAGAFKQEVWNRGLMMWHTQKKDISAEEAVKEVMALVGPAAQASPQPNPGVPGQGAPRTQGARPASEKRPVLPRVDGNGQSPARKIPKNIAELRKRGQELARQGR